MFSLSVPAGKYWGISVRVHFTFFLYIWYRIQSFGDVRWGLAIILGLYLCILLHEFGHALATRFCGGEADEILIWPFGGLAFCRPVFHPTAHLVTTVAGPFVTLLLWIFLSGGAWALRRWGWMDSSEIIETMGIYSSILGGMNFFLLCFNLIPAFPMDGGRILMELLWYKLPFERAAEIAVFVSRMIAIAGGIYGYGVLHSVWILILALLVFFEAPHQAFAVATGSVVPSFSLRDCFHRWRRRKIFTRDLQVGSKMISSETFHSCVVCKRTEIDAPDLGFRVAADGNEYCEDHLPPRMS